MIRRQLFYSVLATACAFVVTSAYPHRVLAETKQGRYEKVDFTVDSSDHTAALWVPPSYSQAKAWPLIVVLHGGGYQGDSHGEIVKWLQRTWPSQPDVPALVLLPQTSESLGWGNTPPNAQMSEWVREKVGLRKGSISVIDAAIDAAQINFRVDPLRISVVGASMGGFGTLRYGALRAEHLAALVPIAAFGTIILEDAKALSKIPIWTFYGDQDPIVPTEHARQMIKAIEEEGGEIRVTEYPGASHAEMCRRPWSNPEVFRWLLNQKREPKS